MQNPKQLCFKNTTIIKMHRIRKDETASRITEHTTTPRRATIVANGAITVEFPSSLYQRRPNLAIRVLEVLVLRLKDQSSRQTIHQFIHHIPDSAKRSKGRTGFLLEDVLVTVTPDQIKCHSKHQMPVAPNHQAHATIPESVHQRFISITAHWTHFGRTHLASMSLHISQHCFMTQFPQEDCTNHQEVSMLPLKEKEGSCPRTRGQTFCPSREFCPLQIAHLLRLKLFFTGCYPFPSKLCLIYVHYIL